jgi:hypothetical protein
MLDCIQVLVLKEADGENITELCRNLFINTKRYVEVDKIDLKNRKIENVEKDSCEDCLFKYRNEDKKFICKILDTNIKKATPGLVITQMKRNQHSDYDMLTQNDGKKVSSSFSTVTVTPNTSQSSNSSSSFLNSYQTSNDQSNSSSSTRKMIKQTVDAFTDTIELAEELDLKQLYKLSDKKKFPTKEFLIENKKKQYTPMLHFYNCISI